MSDFSQVGAICTLQQLRPKALGELQERVKAAADAGRRVGLILPCFGPDLRLPAFAHICRELEKAAWLHRIIISVNAAEAGTLEMLRTLLDRVSAEVVILRTDSEPLRALFRRVLEADDGATSTSGKGFNVWAAIGAAAASGDCDVLVTQDCDVGSFRTEMLVRLCAPCVLPGMPFRFAKMYYPRVSDRLYGRVSRLFFSPLLRAFLRRQGGGALLHYLAAFRYPLAGEMAIDLESAANLCLESGWGLETGVLCDVFRLLRPDEICQVDGGSEYDHRHWPSGGGAVLQKCAREIARVLFDAFAKEPIAPGYEMPDESLANNFREEAQGAIQRSRALAMMNLLPYDEAEEQALIARFAEVLQEPPRPSPPRLPDWRTSFKNHPGICKDLVAVVREAALH